MIQVESINGTMATPQGAINGTMATPQGAITGPITVASI
jgi:hypothetical protein